MTRLSDSALRLQAAILAGETLWADLIELATVRELVTEYREQWEETAQVAERQRALIAELTAERDNTSAEVQQFQARLVRHDTSDIFASATDLANLWEREVHAVEAERDEAREERDTACDEVKRLRVLRVEVVPDDQDALRRELNGLLVGLVETEEEQRADAGQGQTYGLGRADAIRDVIAGLRHLLLDVPARTAPANTDNSPPQADAKPALAAAHGLLSEWAEEVVMQEAELTEARRALAGMQRALKCQETVQQKIAAERDEARAEVQRLTARLLNVERSQAERDIRENPWPSAGFAESNLPSADEQPLGVTISRATVLRFRSSFSGLNEFAAVVCGVPVRELTPMHILAYYAREEDGRQKHPCARCGGTGFAERMPDGEPAAACEECVKP